MKKEKPYIEKKKQVIDYFYNTNYGDNRICECSHKYYRHFDPYEENNACGCKYCGCNTFKEKIFSKNINKKQKEVINELMSKGAEFDKKVENIVWFMGRCLLIQKDGKYDEL